MSSHFTPQNGRDLGEAFLLEDAGGSDTGLPVEDSGGQAQPQPRGPLHDEAPLQRQQLRWQHDGWVNSMDPETLTTVEDQEGGGFSRKSIF